MKLKIKLDKVGLREHFRYSWWQYLVAACFSVFLLGFIHIQTEYRVPENRRIDIYIQSNNADNEKILRQFQLVEADFQTPIESIDVKVIPMLAGNDYAQGMQLFAYIMAGEGDIYFISRERFQGLASQGALINLENYLEDLSKSLDESSLNSTRISSFDESKASVPILYGIPCSKLKIEGLDEYQLDNLIACISVNNSNDSNVIPYFLSMIKSFLR